jgi:hypothetical protein
MMVNMTNAISGIKKRRLLCSVNKTMYIPISEQIEINEKAVCTALFLSDVMIMPPMQKAAQIND